MSILKLKRHEYSELESILRNAVDVRIYRRTQAILWLSEGATVDEVARLLRMSRQTVYNVVSRFCERSGCPLTERLADGVRAGRPASAREVIREVVPKVIETDPRDLGYAQTVWTAELLRNHIETNHGARVSLRSIQTTLRELDLRWKRPRHTLARRAPNWRQAKGG
jgi:transposase